MLLTSALMAFTDIVAQTGGARLSLECGFGVHPRGPEEHLFEAQVGVTGTQSQNFGFLSDPLLANLGGQAERYFADDPNTCLFKLRQFAEVLAKRLGAAVGSPPQPGDNLVVIVGRLEDRGLNPGVAQLFHSLRKAGNQAVHEVAGDQREALYQLKLAYKLGVWFHGLVTKQPNFSAPPFAPPTPPADASQALLAELERLRGDLESARAETESTKALSAQELEAWKAKAEAAQRVLEERLTAEMEAASLAEPTPQEAAQALQEANQTASTIPIDEAETRRMIDAQLREAGWEADTQLLTHRAGVRPQKGRNVAIAEWPTANGPADYVLFVGLTPVAVVEAKRKHKSVADVVQQAGRYSSGYSLSSDEASPGGPWGDFKIPFLFATNGRPFLRQLIEQSGIWFRDARRSENHARALEGWYTPEGISALLQQDLDAATQALENEDRDYLPLRPYQKEALAAVEAALARGQQAMLVAMATGTGKTRTCVCMLYRLLKAKRFRRVLFLVDRSALGDQAYSTFKTLQVAGTNEFEKIYDVKSLGDVVPDSNTRVHIATVQAMVKRVLFPEEGGVPVPVDQYDCIIVDECHRGYSLDRDLSETELTFRSEKEYISVYRRVLDHFDAVKIGLTATPALHTVEIFGEPVHRYSYRQAVIEGHLVDHEPPVRIVTALAEDGMTWKVGQPMQVYHTRQQTLDLVHLPDEVTLELDSFNNRVVTENFNRVVCEELARDIDPELDGKTLIFCVNDDHADRVVRLLKQALDDATGGVNDQAVRKITGAADKVSELIRRFKNERYPSIAVTVDLLTTGIDVPQIDKLVFLRRVRSRILYDQMMGRATRLCPEIGKDKFRIFDAVDLYSGMQDYTDMKPVVAQPNITFEQLVRELADATTDEVRRAVMDQLVAKLQRKKQRMTDEGRRDFESMVGQSPDDLVRQLRGQDPEEAARWFAQHSALASFLDALAGDGRKLIVSEHADEVRRVESGYGKGNLKPADYLEAFEAYLKSHMNEVPALVVVTTRPRDLTRAQLRELELALAEEGYTTKSLQSAWRDTTNQEVAASIIGFIRQRSLGSPLVPYAERVDRALKKLLGSRSWTDPQRQWLEKIALQMKQSTVVDRDSLESEPFKDRGGYKRLNTVFDGQVEKILGDLQEMAWEDEAA